MLNVIKKYFLLLVVGLALLSSAQAAAQMNNDASKATFKDFYLQSRVTHYDRNASDDPNCLPQLPTITAGGVAGGGGGGGGGGSTTPTTGSNNTERAWNFLVGQGFSAVQTAGILGNFMIESGMEPRRVQGGGFQTADAPVAGKGYGLAQWTDAPRQNALKNFAASQNQPVGSLDLQLNFVMHELATSESSSNGIRNQTTIESATIFWLDRYERAGVRAEGERIAAAKKIFDQYSKQTTATPSQPATGGSGGSPTNPAPAAPASGGAGGGGCAVPQPQVGGEAGGGAGGGGSGSSGGGSGGGGAVSGSCTATAPIYGNGGNGRQLKQADFEKLYGPGGSAATGNMVSVDFLGKSVQVHKLVASCLQAVANEIKASNINYTVRSIGGFRIVGGAGGAKLEDGYHYYGVAVDINPDTNPYTSGTAPHDMPQAYVDIFHRHGWSWGGNWRSVKDYMHFEFNGLSVP